MKNQLEIIIKPVTLRFSLYDDEIYYIIGGSHEASLDKAELLMGVGPENCASMLETNLGFIPVCSTVLVRGEKNIIIDPNNYHIGNYGMLGKALELRGLSIDRIDYVVVSHWHHDHSANAGLFSSNLVIGKGELKLARDSDGEEDVKGKIKNYSNVIEVDDVQELCSGVKVIYTPGHTPGSVSVLVDHGNIKTAIMGDSVMTRSEWFDDNAFSHWYTDEQLDGLKKAKAIIKSYQPAVIIPGHDQSFEV